MKVGICTGEWLGGFAEMFEQTAILLPGALRDRTLSIASCMLEATDCPQLLGCQGEDTSKKCDRYGFHEECRGDDRHTCKWHPSVAYEQTVTCGADDLWNPTCMTGKFGAQCGSGECSNDGSGCNGDSLEKCSGGVLLRTDCGQVLAGGTCVAAADGALCAVPGAPVCPGWESCDGDTLVRCSKGLSLSRFNCTKLRLDFTCVETDDHAHCGLPLDERVCEHEGFDQYCQGDVAYVCSGGAWFLMDCSTFLDARCYTDEGIAECRSDLSGR